METCSTFITCQDHRAPLVSRQRIFLTNAPKTGLVAADITSRCGPEQPATLIDRLTGSIRGAGCSVFGDLEMNAIRGENSLMWQSVTEHLPNVCHRLPKPAIDCHALPLEGGFRPVIRTSRLSGARRAFAIDLLATSSVKTRCFNLANGPGIKSERFVATKMDSQSPRTLSPPATSRNPLKKHTNGIRRRSFKQAANRGFGKVREPPQRMVSHRGAEAQRSRVGLHEEASRVRLTSLFSAHSVAQWLRENHLPQSLIPVRFEDFTHPTGLDSHRGAETQRCRVGLHEEPTRVGLTPLCSAHSVALWLRENQLPPSLIMVRFEDSTHPTGRDHSSSRLLIHDERNTIIGATGR